MTEQPESRLSEGEPSMEEDFDGPSEIMATVELMFHIDNPCEAEVAPGDVRNLRKFWINQAKDFLATMTNPYAKELLERKIKEYDQ